MRTLIQTTVEQTTSKKLLLTASLVVISGTFGFIKLSNAMLAGETQTFDEWAVRAMRYPDDLSQPIGPVWMQEVGRDVTGLGGVFALTLITSFVAGFLRMNRRYQHLLFLLATILTGVALSFVLKGVFARPRPNIVPHLSIVSNSSFPSGHAMISTIVYLTLASLVSANLERRRQQIYIFAFGLTIIAMIGVSRVYLGVHYPTDVLAGWTAGIVWVLLAIGVAKKTATIG